jgi:hypothetical protein
MTSECPDCVAGTRAGCQICGGTRRVNCAACGTDGFIGLLESIKSLRETSREDLPSAIRMGYLKEFEYRTQSATELIDALKGIWAAKYMYLIH